MSIKTTYKNHKYTLLNNKGFTLPPYVDIRKVKKNSKK